MVKSARGGKVAGSSGTPDEVAAVAKRELGAADTRHRLLAIYLLGFTAGSRPENMTLLRERAVGDPSWEAQEALAQAFDAYCAAIGYEAALRERKRVCAPLGGQCATRYSPGAS